MNMQELSRLILSLREIGLTGDEITNLLIYVESGNDEYKPKRIFRNDEKNEQGIH